MTEMTENCTPRLRFPEFKKMSWKNGLLSNFISTISPKYKIPLDEYLNIGKIPIIDQSKKYISGYTNNPEYIVSNIIPLIIFGDHTCITKLVFFKFAQGADGIKIFYGHKNICTEYIYQYLNFSPIIMEEYKRHFSILKSKKIYYPEEQQEQQKIADCLSSLDELIDAHEQKCEALKQHKKGLMQRLFPAEGETMPRWRFPEFRDAGEWETYEVGSLFTVTRGEVLAMSEVQMKSTKLFPYPVYSSQTKNNGLAGFYSKYLYEDAITWTTDGVNAGDVNFRKGKFYCTNVCGVLLNNSGYANKCIAELINSIAKKYVSYVGNPKLMNNVMKKILINIPSLPEQQKITDCLSSLDERIEAQEARTAALREHKKGLMQRLFPRCL